MRKPIKEKPILTGFRLYKEHRKIIKKYVSKDVSRAEVVRRALEKYDDLMCERI